MAKRPEQGTDARRGTIERVRRCQGERDHGGKERESQKTEFGKGEGSLLGSSAIV